MRRRWIGLALAIYRWLLILPPKSSLGDPLEMRAVFQEALRAEYARRGWRGAWLFCFGAYLDTVSFAVTEWGSRRRAGRRAGARDRRGFAVMPLHWHLRFAARSLRRTPLVSAVAVATIATAVGLATVVFSAVYGVALRPLPVPEGERIMSLELHTRQPAGPMQFEAAELDAFRRQQRSFQSLEGYFQRRVTLQDGSGEAQSLRAGVVTAGALESLGVAPLLGRTFAPGEDFTEQIRHVVLSHEAWRALFGGRFDLLGETVRIDGRQLEVIGVMPAGFRFPADEQLWLPMDFDWPGAEAGAGRAFEVFGRLADGTGRGEAEAEANLIAELLEMQAESETGGVTARVLPFVEHQWPPGLAAMLTVLGALAVGLLLIACSNLASLLLARATRRAGETSLRRALGAGRLELASPFLCEALVLSVLGAGLGVALGTAGLRLVTLAASDFSLPFWAELRLEPPAIAGATVTAISLALVAGLASAWQLRLRGDALRDGARGLTSRRAGRFSRAIVSFQIALSCALLLGAGLLVRSMLHAQNLDRGYEAHRVMTSDFRLSRTEYPVAARSQLTLALLDRAGSLPGAEGAAMVRSPPGTGPTFSWKVEVEGSGEPIAARADGVPISHGYFSVMGIALLQGRDFLPEESRFGGPPAVIVNRTLAERHLGEAAVGSRLRFGDGEPWLPVVGVVEDSYIGSSAGGLGLTLAKREQIFIAWGIAPYSGGTLLVRSTSDDPVALAPSVRQVMSKLAPSVALYGTESLERIIARSTWAFALFGLIFSLFGGVGLALAVLGLYGVTAFAVEQRLHEVGIRVALGAEPRSILGLILGGAFRQLAWGTVFGLLLGIGLAHSIRALLFGVSFVDPFVYLGIVALLVITGLGAASLSARGALRVDPIRVLAD